MSPRVHTVVANPSAAIPTESFPRKPAQKKPDFSGFIISVRYTVRPEARTVIRRLQGLLAEVPVDALEFTAIEARFRFLCRGRWRNNYFVAWLPAFGGRYAMLG